MKVPDKSVGEKNYSIAFLKDTWRISATGVEKEGEVYNELLEEGVPFVSAIFCQGDVIQSTSDADEVKTGPGSCERVSFACFKPFTSILGQRSLTDTYQTASWNCHNVAEPPITPHTHYRLALVEVGYPLKNLVGTKELMHATHNAFSG